MATLHIDGKTYEADPQSNLLTAALSLGFDLPYFCWHPALGSVGACRQCAVKQFKDENDETGQLVMACMVPATDGTRISITDPEAIEFREAVIEWLMSNHPHDCPVCDEGGECHLQDMTVMAGHSRRRYRFAKRTFRNQYLGPFLNHEMNRCIQCYRCVRFYNDYAGGTDFGAFGAHNHVYFGRHEDGVLENEFSGNLAEVCPTGVFTDKTLKSHYSRKWDMVSAPSVCAHCSIGCNTIASARYGAVRRILNRYHHDINGYFLCDRGRYGYEFTTSGSRPRQPLLRNHGNLLEAADVTDALERAGDILLDAKGVVGIGSPRASLESNFALEAFVGADHFSTGITRSEADVLDALVGLSRQVANGPASLKDAERSDVVFVLGEDPSNTAPRLALALRQSVRQQVKQEAAGYHIHSWHDRAVRDFAQDRKGPLYLAWPTTTRMDDISTETFHTAPDDIARLGFAVAHALDPDSPEVPELDDQSEKLAQRIAREMRDAECPLVVTGTSLGTLSIIQAAGAIMRALQASGCHTARFTGIAPEANSIGTSLLGARSLEEVAVQLENGQADTLIVIENDLYRHLPHDEAKHLLDSARRVIAIDCIMTPTTAHADIQLPAASFAEGDGTLINHEGRAQRYIKVLPPDEAIRESWRWLGGMTMISGRADSDPWPDLDAVLAELSRRRPELGPARQAAPDKDFRINGQMAPRAPRRFSGRTSILAHLSVHEPKPPEDPDAPMNFTMEGFATQPPASLVSHYWSPGWNSVQALNKFQAEVGGPYRGGDPGVRLFPGGEAWATGFQIPSPFQRDESTLLAFPLYEVFGSEELSACSPAIAERKPGPYITLSPREAERRDLKKDSSVTLVMGNRKVTAPLRIDSSLRDGLVGVLTGPPNWQAPRLPVTARIFS